MFQDEIWSVCFNVVVCARIKRRMKKKNSKKKEKEKEKEGKCQKEENKKGSFWLYLQYQREFKINLLRLFYFMGYMV